MRFFRFLLLLHLLFWVTVSAASGQERANVLLLNSYHYGQVWTDDETTGVRDVLALSAKPVELYVQYMDNKRLMDTTHWKNFLHLLEYQYSKTRFSAIVVTDNDAFDFIREYRNRPLFSGVPVIFAGVNYFHQAMLNGLSGFTGVAETFEGAQTVALMQRLHPGVRRIVVVIDSTTTGVAIRKDLEPMLRAWDGKIHFEFWDQLSLEQLRMQLPTLGQDSLVLLMPFARDSSGTFIPFGDLADLVSQFSKVPIYSTYDFYLGHGIVGGRLTSGVAQGRAAAKLLLRVLDGADASLIPVITVSPSAFEFDARQLNRFGLDSVALPPHSQLLFQSWYAMYRVWVWLGAALLASVLLFAWGWGRAYRLKRRSDKALRKVEQSYGLVLLHSPTGILQYDNALTITDCNARLAQILQTPREKLVGLDMKTLKDARILPALWAAIAGREASYEGEYVSTQTGVRILISITCAPDHGALGHEGGIAILEDITARTQAKAEAQEQRNFLATILENEPECVKVTDSNGTVQQMNRAGLDMLEVSGVADINSTGLIQFVVLEHRDAFMALAQRVFAGETGSLEFELQGKQGTRRWVDTHAAPIRDGEGKVTHLLSVTRDVTERKLSSALQDQTRSQLEAQFAEISALQQQLNEQVMRDPLTGLHNRRFLDEALPRELARAKREAYSLAFIMLDLDHFKAVNDGYGHAVGDKVLQMLSTILESSARESDIICRYGGEEFLVALPNMSLERALQRAEQWRLALSTTPIQQGDATIRLTFSAGVAAFPDHGEDVNTLVSCADQAMYRSKNKGRNRITCFELTG